MNFLEINIRLNSDLHDVIIAILSEEKFDSFLEEENTLLAYIDKEVYDAHQQEDKLNQLAEQFNFSFEVQALEDKNWNEEWEKNYDPVIIADKVYVRAHFHKPAEYPYEVIITPQMSFGTGHHSTTSLMVQMLFDIPMENKTVLDAGTGTGLLAIMAKKLGATQIEAYDIDNWSYENSIDNVSHNQCEDIKIYKGTIIDVTLKNPSFEVVLANINKNVLLKEIKEYANKLSENGYLVLSGFYEDDIQDIDLATQNVGLQKKKVLSSNQWACVMYQK